MHKVGVGRHVVRRDREGGDELPVHGVRVDVEGAGELFEEGGLARGRVELGGTHKGRGRDMSGSTEEVRWGGGDVVTGEVNFNVKESRGATQPAWAQCFRVFWMRRYLYVLYESAPRPCKLNDEGTSRDSKGRDGRVGEPARSGHCWPDLGTRFIRSSGPLP